MQPYLRCDIIYCNTTVRSMDWPAMDIIDRIGTWHVMQIMQSCRAAAGSREIAGQFLLAVLALQRTSAAARVPTVRKWETSSNFMPARAPARAVAPSPRPARPAICRHDGQTT
jgi:hypothetical protein